MNIIKIILAVCILNSVSASNNLAEQSIGGASGSHDVSPDQARRSGGLVQLVREQVVILSERVQQILQNCPRRRTQIGQPTLDLNTLEPDVAKAVVNIEMTKAMEQALGSFSQETLDRAAEVMKELGLFNDKSEDAHPPAEPREEDVMAAVAGKIVIREGQDLMKEYSEETVSRVDELLASLR